MDNFFEQAKKNQEKQQDQAFQRQLQAEVQTREDKRHQQELRAMLGIGAELGAMRAELAKAKDELAESNKALDDETAERKKEIRFSRWVAIISILISIAAIIVAALTSSG